MKRVTIPAIRDINASIPRYRVRRDGLRGRNSMFPFFLHLCVHDKEGVMREVDGDLSFIISVIVVVVVVVIVVVTGTVTTSPRRNTRHPKLPLNAQTQAPNDRPRP